MKMRSLLCLAILVPFILIFDSYGVLGIAEPQQVKSLTEQPFMVEFTPITPYPIRPMVDYFSWERYGSNTVMSVTGVRGEWDAGGAAAKSCIQSGGLYHLFYQGDSGDGGAGSILIGKATSRDLVTWSKSKVNPVLTVGGPGSWDSYFVGMPSVIKVGNYWYMFYEGNDGIHSNIGLATSFDGETFKKINFGIGGTSKVLEIGPVGTWDDNNVGTPTVIKAPVSSGYRYALYYVAQQASDLNVATGVAYSNDLIHWVKEPVNPVLNNGIAGAWDETDVTCGDVVVNSWGVYTMYYCARGPEWNIGVATSYDGKTWIRSTDNPILTGSGTGWDSNNVQLPLCPRPGYLLYSGAGSYYQVGLCTQHYSLNGLLR